MSWNALNAWQWILSENQHDLEMWYNSNNNSKVAATKLSFSTLFPHLSCHLNAPKFTASRHLVIATQFQSFVKLTKLFTMRTSIFKQTLQVSTRISEAPDPIDAKASILYLVTCVHRLFYFWCLNIRNSYYLVFGKTLVAAFMNVKV